MKSASVGVHRRVLQRHSVRLKHVKPLCVGALWLFGRWLQRPPTVDEPFRRESYRSGVSSIFAGPNPERSPDGNRGASLKWGRPAGRGRRGRLADRLDQRVEDIEDQKSDSRDHDHGVLPAVLRSRIPVRLSHGQVPLPQCSPTDTMGGSRGARGSTFASGALHLTPGRSTLASRSYWDVSPRQSTWRALPRPGPVDAGAGPLLCPGAASRRVLAAPFFEGRGRL